MDLLEWTVNETLAAAPDSAEILNRLAIDTCCGGTLTLAEAARSVGLAPERLLAALEPVLAGRQ